VNEAQPGLAGRRSRRWLSILIGYFGILEAAHLVVILWAGLHFTHTGKIGFPALPPGGGWSVDVTPWLIGNGALDFIFAIAGIRFCFQYFRRRGTWFRWGIFSLSGALYSAGIFAFGTIPGGAWRLHPLAYGLLAAVFSPILPCLYLLWRHAGAAEGTMWKQGM
jgi:hypothetical protein